MHRHIINYGFGNITLKGSVANLSGTRIISDEVVGKKTEAEIIGKKLAKSLILNGAKKLLDDLR